MATKRRLIHFKTFDNFNQMKLSANDDNTQYTVGINGSVISGTDVDVPYQAIAFIKDTEQIWTHGKLYNNTQVIDLGTVTVQDSKFTFSNQENVTRIIARDPKQPMIFKYSVQGAGSFIQYCPVQISIDDSTFQYMWNDISNSIEFSMIFTYQGSEASLYRADARFHDYSKDISDLNDKISSSEGKIDSNTNNIEGLGTDLNKLLGINNVYIIDFATINTMLDDIPVSSDNLQNYETQGEGILSVNPGSSDKSSVYVILDDSVYLQGIAPATAEYFSDTEIKISFINKISDMLMRVSFMINPETKSAWGLQVDTLPTIESYINEININQIYPSENGLTFSCTIPTQEAYKTLQSATRNYWSVPVVIVSYLYNNIRYEQIASVSRTSNGYMLVWNDNNYSYTLTVTKSYSYEGNIIINPKYASKIVYDKDDNSISLQNLRGQNISSMTLPSQSTSVDLTSNWDGTLNFNDYDYAYAELTSSKVLRSITGPRGHYQVTLSVRSYSGITLNAIQTGNIRYFKNGIRIPSESYFTFNAHQTIILDITIDSTIIVNVITIGENSPLLPTSQYTTATQDMVFFRTIANITGIANISSLVSGMRRGVCTLVFNNGSGFNINALGSYWKVFLNGMKEAFPVTLSAGLHIVKVTKWDNDTAIVEITG